MVYLWQHFRALHRARRGNGFGPDPIPWSEIESYNRLTSAGLGAWEAEAIRLMDDLFLASAYTKD